MQGRDDTMTEERQFYRYSNNKENEVIYVKRGEITMAYAKMQG